MTEIISDTSVSYRDATCNGIHARIYHSTQNPHSKKHQPFIVFLHGWMGCISDFNNLAQLFAIHGFQAICIDLPYHAQSVNCSPKSLDDSVRIIKDAIMDFIALAKKELCEIVLVGYSLGGRLAFEIAASLEKDKNSSFGLNTLVLLSSAFPPRSEDERNACQQVTLKQVSSLGTIEDNKEAYENWLRKVWYSKPMWGSLCKSTRFDELISQKISGFTLNQKKQWIHAATILGKAHMRTPEMKLKVPVLYVSGSSDLKYSTMGNSLHTFFEQYEHYQVGGTGHNVLCEITSETLSVIARFVLKQVSTILTPFSFVQLDCKLKPYSILTNTSFIVGDKTIDRRDGVLLTIFNSSGIAGVGDICPLPGLHNIEVCECLIELENFSSLLRRTTFCSCAICSMETKLLSLCSSFCGVVANGITCAITHFISRLRDVSMRSTIASLCQIQDSDYIDKGTVIKLNGVLPRYAASDNKSYKEEIQSRYDKFVTSSGFETLKFKVGTLESVEEEVEITRSAVRCVREKGKKIRLDANCSWTREEFLSFQSMILSDARSIEFMEEPFRSSKDLEKYLCDCDIDEGIDLALDESLQYCSLKQIRSMASSSKCVGFVIKPAVLGYFPKIIAICEIAKRNGCKIVLSSIYESAVGLCWNALLASSLGSEDVGHGLGTFRLLKEDVLDCSFEKCCAKGCRTHVDVQKSEQLLNEIADLLR